MSRLLERGPTLLRELLILGFLILALPLVIIAAIVFLIPGLILWLGATLARRQSGQPQAAAKL